MMTWIRVCVCLCVGCSLCEFVACAAVLSLVVPCCGIPALYFAVRSHAFYRQGDVSASRTANLTALRLITAAGVCVCVLAVAASVLVVVISYHDDRTSTALQQVVIPTPHSSARSTARQLTAADVSLPVSAFEKVLHGQEALGNKPPRARNNVPRGSDDGGGFRAMIGLTRLNGRRRSGVGSTTARPPRFKSGFMRRLRTWNRRNKEFRRKRSSPVYAY